MEPHNLRTHVEPAEAERSTRRIVFDCVWMPRVGMCDFGAYEYQP